MAEALCGWCGVQTYMTPMINVPLRTHDHLETAPFTCANCHAISVARWHNDVGLSAQPERGAYQLWTPQFVEGQTFPDVPEDIAEAASEAYRCRSIDAFRGSVAIARAVVESSAKASGSTEHDLFRMIDGLYDRRLIRQHIRDAAHEIRHLGNDVAHGEFVEPVTAEECDEILNLMAELLRELFQSPAEVARRKAAREAKQSV